MTQRERQLLSWIQENPLISQQELADKAGITRSSVAVHISNLMRKGHILGKGYLLKEQEYVVGIGAGPTWMSTGGARPRSTCGTVIRDT